MKGDQNLSTTERCDRCKRRCRNDPECRCNVVFRKGIVLGYVFPECQTPEENAQATENLGKWDYSRQVELSDGRMAVPPMKLN